MATLLELKPQIDGLARLDLLKFEPSRFVNEGLYSGSEKVDRLLDSVRSSVLDNINKERKRNASPKTYCPIIDELVLNLCACYLEFKEMSDRLRIEREANGLIEYGSKPYLSNHELFKLRVPRGKSYYEGEGLNYGMHIKIQDSLVALGYMKLVTAGDGFYDTQNRVSRYAIGDELASLIDFPLSDIRLNVMKRVELKDYKVKKFRDPQLTKEQKLNVPQCMVDNLEKINSFMLGVDVTFNPPKGLPLDDLITDRGFVSVLDRQYKRVFNNRSYEQGGRFYGGWWQHVPQSEKKFRSYIQINGNPTAELDYKAMHPHILYSREGIDLTDDPYAIDLTEYGLPPVDSDKYKHDIRPIVKQLFNALLNAKGRLDRVKIVKDAMEGCANDYALCLNESRLKSIANVMLDKLKDKHKAIRKYFNQGEGVKLQYIDSQIAEAVMLDMVGKGIPVLSIHDSFIVEVEHRDKLKQSMLDSYSRVVGKPPLDIT